MRSGSTCTSDRFSCYAEVNSEFNSYSAVLASFLPPVNPCSSSGRTSFLHCIIERASFRISNLLGPAPCMPPRRFHVSAVVAVLFCASLKRPRP